MKVQEKHTYHGQALAQIVEHKSFKALNRASANYGHYIVNADRHVFVKYSTKPKPPWGFQFSPADLAAIKSVSTRKGVRIFLALVCGRSTVCLLRESEFTQVIAIGPGAQQSIRVEVPKGGSCHVHGSQGDLAGTIPHNIFPDRVFK